MRRGTITVSASKRGTTVRATGHAAKVLFDAIAEPKSKLVAPPSAGTVYASIDFEDQGQDFLRWDVEQSTGVVFACGPYQAWVWIGKTVLDLTDLRPGHLVRFSYGGERKTVSYPVRRITFGRVL